MLLVKCEHFSVKFHKRYCTWCSQKTSRVSSFFTVISTNTLALNVENYATIAHILHGHSLSPTESHNDHAEPLRDRGRRDTVGARSGEISVQVSVISSRQGYLRGEACLARN